MHPKRYLDMKPDLLLKRRHRRKFKRATPPGASPGTIAATAEALPTQACVLAYGPDSFYTQEAVSDDDIRKLYKQHPITWIDIAGTRDTDRLRALGELFHLHPLALEDAVNVHQRAKVEDYGDYLFIIARMAPLENEEDTDQLSMFLGPDYLITIQERPGDVLGPVRDRIRKGASRIRKSGPDYLMYSILDAVIDAYFPLLEKYGEILEDLEDDTILHPEPALLTRIYSVRRKLLALRRAIWPLREAANLLVRDQSIRIDPGTQVYLRDCYDHTVQIIDLMESYRELSSGLMDVYLSSVSNRMNEVMKVLTIITTIFIPLSFVAGIYGMNFDTERSPWNMPELKAYYGYPVTLAVMLSITLVQLYFFKKRGWLGTSIGSRRIARKREQK